MTNIELGKMAFGCWRLSETNTASVETRIKTALDAGITLIDTADIYGYGDQDRAIYVDGANGDGFGGAEALLGRCLAAQPSLRSQMVLATKGGIRPPQPYNSSREYLTAALDASLSRLRTDYVDLYQIHRPDLLTDYPALAETLDNFVTSGKVRALGVSNFTPAQIRALAQHLKTPLLTLQPEISLWETQAFEDGTLDVCAELSLRPLAWSPLGRGTLLLAPKNDAMKTLQSTLSTMAQKYDATSAQIALAFLLRHPIGIIPIIGTQTPKRIMSSADAINITLSREDWYALYVARRGQAMP